MLKEIYLRRVAKYIEEEKLFHPKDYILVALSGGADSVALLLILNELNYKCAALHCNFHLRGDESDRDEAFVTELCKKYNIPLFKTSFDTVSFAKKEKISTEMAARNLRYNWFEKMRSQLNANHIAVAHHADDAIETFMINLSRGTGIHGLTGIRLRNNYIVRPLLCLGRHEIISFLSALGQSHVEDSTNAENIFTRNKYRNIIIPEFEKVNPAFKKNAYETINNIAMAEAFIRSQIKKIENEIVEKKEEGELRIAIQSLHLYGNERFILFEILQAYGFTPSSIEDIAGGLDGESGKIYFSKEYRLIKDRTHLILQPYKGKDNNSFIISCIADFSTIPIIIKAESLKTEETEIEKDKSFCYMDADKIEFPLLLRHWQEGDFFVPFGMKGKKKLSDYFSDHHFSIIEKEKTWILSKEDKILWIVGERTDDRFKITADTKQILKLQYKK